MRLISMVEFIGDRAGLFETANDYSVQMAKKLDEYEKYSCFLSQPLEQWMFVPTDEEGNVLEEPVSYDIWLTNPNHIKDDYRYVCEQYQKAKERVLFEGDWYDYDDHKYKTVLHITDGSRSVYLNNIRSLEELCYIGLTLTPTAIKQIGL